LSADTADNDSERTIYRDYEVLTMSTRTTRKTDSATEVGVPEMVTISDVETIVAKAVKAAVSVVREEFEKLIKGMKDQIQSLEERIEHLENDARPRDVPDVTELCNKIDAVTRENRRISVAANEAEQYNRRNNIRIRGLAVKKDDDCRKVVLELIRSKLHVPVSDDDIELAHPVPLRSQANQASSGSDVVMVRFRHREVRDQVIRQRKLLKNSKRTIVEDLTALNLELINRLKKTPRVEKTWSWNGHVYALLRDGRKLQVKPYESVPECDSRS